jgi:hypothetical protein
MDIMTVILSVLVLAIAGMFAELVRKTWIADCLAERNAAQAVTIMGLQRRLRRSNNPENPAAGHDLKDLGYPSTFPRPIAAVAPDFEPEADADVCCACFKARKEGCGCGVPFLR